MRGLFVALGFVLGLCGAPRRAWAGDPYLSWWTIETPHFRVHFHGGLEGIAARAASIAERTHQRLVPQLGWEPTQITDIVITDQTDGANGIATGLPYNQILLFVTAPDDMSPLGDYDDWQLDLITHEYTHILHVDNVSGLPAIVNAILGRTYTPNQSQPRWILEGLAVAMESEHTTAGRLRGTQFDMYLRADVLEDRIATLDEISTIPRRWPGGNLWYLYGSKFIEWILDTYGRDTFAEVATHYGRFVIPYGINRAIRRATGRTYPELYAAWKMALKERYGAMARAIRARGLREGRRLTHHGQIAFNPRFVPRACQESDEAELVYYRSDGHERSGLYRVPASGQRAGEIVTRTNAAVASFAPDCSIVFQSVAPSRRGHFFNELLRLPAHVRSPSGLDERRERLTIGARARDPDVAPDGRRIAYVTNHAGTSTLRLAELDAQGRIQNPRALVPSGRFEQAYTPRFSPDGTRLAYGVWTSGGFRDVRIVDLATQSFYEIQHDRAIDQQPAWSPDGKTVYFTSDRSGVPNVYAFDLETRALSQVTNVLTGAYMPELSPDGKTLVYVGYTSFGFDLFGMPLDRARFLEPGRSPTRESGAVSLPPERWPVKPYSPFQSLRPRAYEIEYGSATFGNAFTLRTEGSDAIAQNFFAAQLVLETEAPAWQGSIDYVNSRLPFNFHATLFRSRAPRDDYRIGEREIRVSEDAIGLTTGVSLFMPGEFESQSAGLSYTISDYTHEAPIGTRVDPWSEVPVEPSTSLLASVRLGYAYSNAEGSGYGISAERGFSLFLGTDFADPALGSDSTLAAFSGSLTGYFPSPIARHHVLALALSGGSSGGTYPRRGLYATGGFADQPAFDVYTTGIRQSAFVLRGYEPGQFVGTEYTLLNAEYRFPIAYVDRGVSTLPVFLRHLNGTLFFDWGGAYFGIDPDDPLAVLHPGAGAELWLDLVLGYRVSATLRLGVAKGLDDEAPSGLQTYFVAASGF